MPGTRKHYTVDQLGNGICAAIHRPDGFAICNSGLVDLGGGRLVFDTGLTSDSALELREVATSELGASPSLIANSHWHLDHTLGNREFPGMPIWGTRRTREIMIEVKDDVAKELQRSALQAYVDELEARRPATREGAPLQDLEFTLLIHRALLANLGRLEHIPPSETFETRVELPGTRRAQLISFGSGHTAADAILWLPKERVLFAGDLVCRGVQPSMGSGDPDHWLVVLDQIEKLGPSRVVPGHGPVCAPGDIQETRDYVEGVLAAARAGRELPLPATIRGREGSVSLEQNLTFAREWVKTHPPVG